MPGTADFLTTAQAAARLGVSAGQLRKLAAIGKVRADRTFPKAMRFDPEELARYDANLQPGRGRPRKAKCADASMEPWSLNHGNWSDVAPAGQGETRMLQASPRQIGYMNSLLRRAGLSAGQYFGAHPGSATHLEFEVYSLTTEQASTAITDLRHMLNIPYAPVATPVAAPVSPTPEKQVFSVEWACGCRGAIRTSSQERANTVAAGKKCPACIQWEASK